MNEKDDWDFPNMQSLSRGDDYPPDLRPRIQRYVDHLYRTAQDQSSDSKSTHAATTVDDYKQDLNWFEVFLRLNDLTIEDIEPYDALDIGVYLGDAYSGSTAGTRYRNIRRLYGFLKRGKDVTENPFAEWTPSEDCGITENESQQRKEMDTGELYGPSPDEITRMIESIDSGYQTRDSLIILMLYDTGARSSELCGVRYQDIDGREVYIRPETAKYSRDRYVKISRQTKVLLQDWTEKYRDNEAYAPYSEHVFPTSQRAAMSTDTVETAVKDAAENAGLNEDLWTDANDGDRSKITPHNLRYSCGYYMLYDENDEPRPDANIYHVSQYLGHSSVEITERVYIDHNPNLPKNINTGEDLM